MNETQLKEFAKKLCKLCEKHKVNVANNAVWRDNEASPEPPNNLHPAVANHPLWGELRILCADYRVQVSSENFIIDPHEEGTKHVSLSFVDSSLH